MQYVVITAGPDGISVESMGKDELEEGLNESYWGSVSWLPAVSKEDDPNCWGTLAPLAGADKVGLILKGAGVALPRTVETVTRVEVE